MGLRRTLVELPLSRVQTVGVMILCILVEHPVQMIYWMRSMSPVLRKDLRSKGIIQAPVGEKGKEMRDAFMVQILVLCNRFICSTGGET